MFNIINNMIDSVVETADDFVSDPLGTTVDIATQPVRDSLEVLQGLSVGELRTRAALRIGADAVVGMAVSELIEVLLEE